MNKQIVAEIKINHAAVTVIHELFEHYKLDIIGGIATLLYVAIIAARRSGVPDPDEQLKSLLDQMLTPSPTSSASH